jgi:diguanylate cyclase (GGDEF)-like protein
MKNNFMTILLVEDESDVQAELKRFLQRYCTTVITANNGEEGLKLYQEHNPDIVISDIKMPIMNGIDMTRKIKALSPNQIIIFTTAHSDNGYLLKSIEMQVEGYILKPIDLRLLKRKIDNISQNLLLQREKKLYETVLDDIAHMQDSMLAVYDENKEPIFYNKTLLSFLGYKSLHLFLKNHTSLSNKFERGEEYYHPLDNTKHWLEELMFIDSDKRVISMKDIYSLESKLFLVNISHKKENHHTIVTFSEITSIIKQKHQYLHNSYTDELTQVNNRTRFNILFEASLEQLKNDQKKFSIILMDIDHFKNINDTHGHLVGDNILKMFSTLIQDNIRNKDSLSRWGGEEFVLLLSDTSLHHAKNIAEKLRLLIEAHHFNLKETLTCSFGVAQGDKTDTIQSLFKRVDSALYKAKENGRNKVVTHV